MTDDYAVASFATMNPATWEGTSACFMMEEISVRNGDGGHQCSNCYAPWVITYYTPIIIDVLKIEWQNSQYHLHVDSSHDHCDAPELYAEGFVGSEDNWGYYGSQNPAFACSESSESTTNLWFQHTVKYYAYLPNLF